MSLVNNSLYLTIKLSKQLIYINYIFHTSLYFKISCLVSETKCIFTPLHSLYSCCHEKMKDVRKTKIISKWFLSNKKEKLLSSDLSNMNQKPSELLR